MKKSLQIVVALTVLLMLTFEMSGQVVDYDGNVYDTLVIGNQVWLKQNLKTTHYRNGVPIPNVADSITWASLNSGARCYYANDSAAYDSIYGVLYNWYAVNDANELCPEGWHVSSDAEWTAAGSFLGGDMVAGGKMKEAGTAHWLPPNVGATNSSGFTGLPGGMRGMESEFGYLHENGLWWCSTQQSFSNGWGRYLWYMFAGIDRNPVPKYAGQSVRCIKDVNTGTGSKNPGPRFCLYPNPAFGRITVSWPGVLPVNLEMVDMRGEKVFNMVLTDDSKQIDVNTLPSGIYFVRIFNDACNEGQLLFKQ